jgi:hypothetical protein
MVQLEWVCCGKGRGGERRRRVCVKIRIVSHPILSLSCLGRGAWIPTRVIKTYTYIHVRVHVHMRFWIHIHRIRNDCSGAEREVS